MFRNGNRAHTGHGGPARYQVVLLVLLVLAAPSALPLGAEAALPKAVTKTYNVPVVGPVKIINGNLLVSEARRALIEKKQAPQAQTRPETGKAPVATPNPTPAPTPLEPRVSDPSVTVLMYHNIAPANSDLCRDGTDLTVSIEDFRAQMQYLKDRGYTTITVEQLRAFLYEGASVPPKSLLLTFDDGYASNVFLVAPILQDYGFHGAIFVIGSLLVRAGSISEPKDFRPDTIQYFSWSAVNPLPDAIELQAHTYHGHRWENGQAALLEWRQEQIADDLRAQLKDFEGQQGLAQPIAIAYPYGSYDQETIAALRDVGLKIGFAVYPGRVYSTTNPFEVPRYRVFPGLDLSTILP